MERQEMERHQVDSRRHPCSCPCSCSCSCVRDWWFTCEESISARNCAASDNHSHGHTTDPNQICICGCDDGRVRKGDKFEPASTR